MRKNDLSVFKLEQEGFKITLKRGADFQPVITHASGPSNFAALPALPMPQSSAAPAASAPPVAEKEVFREIVSPMVGTFYAAPKPDSPPYASPGTEVTREETVVCIIEAMKVMNEIKPEISGTIVEVVAESGKPVQFGQVLFRVR